MKSKFIAEIMNLIPNLTDEEWEEQDRKVAAWRAANDSELSVQRAADRLAQLEADGVPRKDLGPLSELDVTAACAAITAAGNFSILVLSGPPGVGKTTAGVWWLRTGIFDSARKATRRRRFVDASQLTTWSRYDEDRMADLERASALVIDELGVEYDDKTGAGRSMVDAILNRRYAAELPTVITTNLNAAEFTTRYGERIVDRIREAGEFHEIVGESLRKKSK